MSISKSTGSDVSNILQNVCKSKKVVQVWNGMRMSRWWFVFVFYLDLWPVIVRQGEASRVIHLPRLIHLHPFSHLSIHLPILSITSLWYWLLKVSRLITDSTCSLSSSFLSFHVFLSRPISASRFDSCPRLSTPGLLLSSAHCTPTQRNHFKL